jgi:hypothetical protein
MQKLGGISSGQNNKSCGIFHHESNKISISPRRHSIPGGLGMRAVWGRSELRWEGARGPREARGGLENWGASAGARQVRGGERRRGGRALGEILLGLPLFEIVFLQIFE